jgi:3-oxoacyl-[acyl-carrier protein] reductase
VLRPLKDALSSVETAPPYELAPCTSTALAGKVAIVTGASGTIGRAIAARLGAAGAQLHLPARSMSRLEPVADELRHLGIVASTSRVDLSSPDEVADFVTAIGRIDILVNCAGGSARGANAPIWEQSAEVVDEILNSNLRTAITMTQEVARVMVVAGSGRVISVGSVLGDHGKANFADYAAAKAGLKGYMRSAAIELGPHGVTVNLVSPGIVPRGNLVPSQLERIAETNVFGRFGTAESVAETVAFLAGPGAEFITGVDVPVDGGRSLGLRGDR